MKCANSNCNHYFWYGEAKYPSKYYRGSICQKCSERENMPNIKITAEVDGKQVPLSTISTESFEAIKALQKPKEIPVPVARVGNWPGRPDDRRLFLKISNSFRKRIIEHDDIKMVAIDLKTGYIANSWTEIQREPAFYDDDLYENIKPL